MSGGQLMGVAVTPGPALNLGNPRALFSVEGYRRARNHQQYDVAPDGRFLMIREPPPATDAVYVQGWLNELRAKLRR